MHKLLQRLLYSLFIVSISFFESAAQENYQKISTQHNEVKKSKKQFIYLDASVVPIYYMGYGRTLYQKNNVSMYARAGFHFFKNFGNFDFQNKVGICLEQGVLIGKGRNQLELGLRMSYFYSRFEGFWLAKTNERHQFFNNYYLLNARIGWRYTTKNERNWLGVAAFPQFLIYQNNSDYYPRFFPLLAVSIGRFF